MMRSKSLRRETLLLKRSLRIESLEKRAMLAAEFSLEPIDIAPESLDHSLSAIVSPPSLSDTPFGGVLIGRPNQEEPGGLLELRFPETAFDSSGLEASPSDEARFSIETIRAIEQIASENGTTASESTDGHHGADSDSKEGGLVVLVASELPDSQTPREVETVRIEVSPVMGHVRNVELVSAPGHDRAHDYDLANTLVSFQMNDRFPGSYSPLANPAATSQAVGLQLTDSLSFLDSGLGTRKKHADPIGSWGDSIPQNRMANPPRQAYEVDGSWRVPKVIAASATSDSGESVSAAGELPGHVSSQSFGWFLVEYPTVFRQLLGFPLLAEPRREDVPGDTADILNETTDVLQTESRENRFRIISVTGENLFSAGALIVAGMMLSTRHQDNMEPSRRYSAGDMPRQRRKALLKEEGDS